MASELWRWFINETTTTSEGGQLLQTTSCHFAGVCKQMPLKAFPHTIKAFCRSSGCISRVLSQNSDDEWEQWDLVCWEYPMRLTLWACWLGAMSDLQLLRLCSTPEERNKYIWHSQRCTPPFLHPLCPHMCEIKAITALHLTENAIFLDKTFHLQQYQWRHIFLLWWPESHEGNSNKTQLHVLWVVSTDVSGAGAKVGMHLRVCVCECECVCSCANVSARTHTYTTSLICFQIH